MKDRLRLFGLDPLPKTIEEAISVQKKLSSKIILEDDFESLKSINLVAGVDVSYKDKLAKASVVLFRFKDMSLVGSVTDVCTVEFPYIPGFLSFREIPPILKAFEKLKLSPDLILCDGQGIAHPKQMGIATHIGILLNIPTIGVAKSKLVGSFKEPGDEKGKWTPLFYRNKVVGAVLRTRKGVKPVFVSPGYKICLETSIKIVMHTVKKFRLPEPIRLAHQLTKGADL